MMKIFTRILATSIAGLALVGGMSLGAQADTSSASNGAAISVGDLTVTANGPWSYQQGSAMRINACVNSDATAAHHFTAADFTVSTTSGQVAAQALQPSAQSFPAQVDVKPGSCVTGYVMVPTVSPAEVTTINYSGHSWKAAGQTPTATPGKIALALNGMFVKVSNVHVGDSGLWEADLAITAQTPVHFSASQITFVAGGKESVIFNHEGSGPAGMIPLEADLAAGKSLSGKFTFATDVPPTALIVEGVTYSIGQDNTGTTATVSIGKSAVSKSGMLVKVSNLHRGDAGLWVADISVTAKTAVHFSAGQITYTAGGSVKPIFNYEGSGLPGSIPLESDLAAGQTLSGQISFGTDSQLSAITVDGVNFTIAPNNAGPSNDKPAAGRPGLPKTGN